MELSTSFIRYNLENELSSSLSWVRWGRRNRYSFSDLSSRTVCKSVRHHLLVGRQLEITAFQQNTAEPEKKRNPPAHQFSFTSSSPPQWLVDRRRRGIRFSSRRKRAQKIFLQFMPSCLKKMHDSFLLALHRRRTLCKMVYGRRRGIHRVSVVSFL